MPVRKGPLIRITRDPLFGLTRDQLVERFRELLRGRAEAAYLFGSITGADFNKFSDVDLLVVARTEKPFLERAPDFDDLFDVIPSLDLLIYTQEEFAGLTCDPSPGFWRSVTRTLQRIL
jgi:predicted nucleotidyltransferase